MTNTRTYECMILLDNREVKNGWQALKDQVAGVFAKHRAELVSARRWDERRLAYPIGRQNRATYLLAYCNAGTDDVAAIRRDLQFNEAVLRSFMLAVDEIPEEAFQPEESFDESSVQVDEIASAAPAPPAEPKAEVAEKPGDAADADEPSEKQDAPPDAVNAETEGDDSKGAESKEDEK